MQRAEAAARYDALLAERVPEAGRPERSPDGTHVWHLYRIDVRGHDNVPVTGPALLVAPVFQENGEAKFYLPAGQWRHLLTGETAEGPGWQTTTHDYFSLPLWVDESRGGKWDCLSRFTG